MRKQKSSSAEQVNPKGQSGMLQRIVKETYVIVGIGIFLLLVFAGLNLYSNRAMTEQVENTQYLNQYRLGSKNLTSAVQSYAVTGDETYKNNYNKELNEDKNRDTAWSGLEANHLESGEWDELNQISEMSQGLYL